ncbi:MAG: hypothetical protein Fur005_28700 [Roseiflexaceae bacterium]
MTYGRFRGRKLPRNDGKGSPHLLLASVILHAAQLQHLRSIGPFLFQRRPGTSLQGDAGEETEGNASG